MKLIFSMGVLMLLISQVNGQPVSIKKMEEVLLPFFGENLKYVDRSKIGLSILTWKVKDGEIYDENVINPLSEDLKKEMIRVLKLTSGSWDKIDSVSMYYCPIKFKNNGYEYYTDELPESIKKMATSEIVIQGYGYYSKFVSDDNLINKLNKFLQKEEYSQCLDIANEILRRNPFSYQILEIRILCLNKLKEYKLACDDIDFIKQYLNKSSKSNCVKNL